VQGVVASARAYANDCPRSTAVAFISLAKSATILTFQAACWPRINSQGEIQVTNSASSVIAIIFGLAVFTVILAVGWRSVQKRRILRLQGADGQETIIVATEDDDVTSVVATTETTRPVAPRRRNSMGRLGGHMARYTVHVPQSDMAMGLESPLSAVEAYYKVRELREMGFTTVSLRNIDTGEEIDDVASLVRDSPEA